MKITEISQRRIVVVEVPMPDGRISFEYITPSVTQFFFDMGAKAQREKYKIGHGGLTVTWEDPDFAAVLRAAAGVK